MGIWENLGMGGYRGFSRPAARLLQQAVQLAGDLGCEQADTSHLLLAMLRQQGAAAQFLTRKNITEPEVRRQLAQSQSRLKKLEELLRQVRQQEQFSVESIGDIAYLMERRTQLKRVHTVMLLAGLPMSLLEVTGVVLWIVTGVWWPCAVYLLLSVPFGILISRYYFRRVAYLCPQCHTVFRPVLKEAFFARHTPSARKLTCTCCGYHGFCVETIGGDGV